MRAWAAANAGRLAHAHTLAVDGRVRGAALGYVARLAAATPSLQRLRLPGLRLSGGGCSSRRGGDVAGRRESESGGGRRESDGAPARSRRESDAGDGAGGSGERRPESCTGGDASSASRRRRGSDADPDWHCSRGDRARHRTSDCGGSGDGAGAPDLCGRRVRRAANPHSRREEQYLVGMLGALPCLVELDLGGPGGSCSGSAPLPASVLGAVARLRGLASLRADASGTRDGRCAAALLEALPMLERLALRASAPGDAGAVPAGGCAVLATALCGLTRLEALELEADELGPDFADALHLGRLKCLQSLSLGLCPGLPPAIVTQVRREQRAAVQRARSRLAGWPSCHAPLGLTGCHIPSWDRRAMAPL